MKIRATIRRWKLLHRDAARLQFAPLLFLAGTTEDEYIVCESTRIRCTLHQARVQRKSETRIKNHAQQRTSPWIAAAIREQRIVSEDSPHAHQNGIALVTLS